MIIYVAGPYRKFTDEQGIVHTVQENIDRAMAISATLWEAGHIAFCPHGNTAHIETYMQKKLPPERYLQGDIELLKLCDAIYMLPYWRYSDGARGEHQKAINLGMPNYYHPNLPPLHPTEVRCPEQVKAFREILGGMMRTHLKKNADYSPANIMGTGEIGVVTRLWDKTARLMNLVGFKIDINMPVEFVEPKEPRNESIDDTYSDLAVYAIIGKLLRSGDWGR